MITKVKRVKNVGKFYDFSCQVNELNWHKNTFLFAPNAYGKSTLVNVFRSLRDNDPKTIQARKTLSVLTQPEVVIIVDGDNHIFNGTKWDKPYPLIRIFDTPFIHANILSYEIEHEHKKSIHRIIIGAQGVKLAQELASLKKKEKERRKDLDSLAAKFRSAGFIHFTLDSFLSIPTTEEVNVVSRIKRLEQDIKSKESETQVRALGNPSGLSAPTFDLSGLKALLAQNIADVHEEAKTRVEAHIARNIKDRNLARGFIQQGLDLMQADCPFCGQDMKTTSDLITAYQQYFDEAFRAYQQQLVQQAEGFAKWNLENELTTIVSIHNANTVLVKQWEPFIGVMAFLDIASTVESWRAKLAELRAKAQAEVEKKQKDPNADVDLSALDRLAAKLADLKGAIDTCNGAVLAFFAKTKDFIARLPKSDVDSIRRALAREREIETRFKSEWKQWATDYRKAKEDTNSFLSQRNAKEKELANYTETIFKTHEKRINQLLLTLGADFAITDLTGKTDEKANEAYSDFAFLILEKKVPLTTRQDDAPCFKNTLSEGDKSTLAFAFFMAALEKSSDLDKQIVIFDDPLSSLDENRREATARVLMDLSPRLKQLCVFTHKKDFLRMLFDKMPDNKVLQIRSDKKNGSWIEAFDVEEDRKSEMARLVDDMERYLTEDFGPIPGMMQGNIRKLFEIVLKTKYYRTLATDIKGKKGLSILLQTLYNKCLLDAASKSTLFNLCNLSNGPHHGDIVELPERKLSRDELLPLIREALVWVEKV